MNATMRVPRLLVSALVLVPACGKRPPSDPQAATRSQAALAADSSQARLWQGAVGRGAPQSALIHPVDTALTTRHQLQVPTRQAPTQPVAFPAEMRAGLRLDAMPDLPGGNYVGVARAVQITGEQVELELADRQRIRLTARARGGPLRLAANDSVQLELRVRDDPANRQRIVALRTRAGDGIVSVLETGSKPVVVTIQLFGLVARQMGSAERGTMPVEVQIRGERRVLTQGQVVDFADAGLSVGLIGSTALTGADRFRAEGNPYAIDLIAWRR